MKSTAPLKAAKTSYIISSAAFCAIGLMLMIHPAFSVSFIGIICGTAMIVFGGVKIFGYFSKDLFRLAFQYDLATGILLLVLGVVVIIKPDRFMNLICISLGITILAEGLFKVQIAIDSKRFGISRWWLIMTMAALAGIHGILLIFRPAASGEILTIILGISLLCEGILNLITVLTAVKIVKNQRPDVIEIKAEIKDKQKGMIE